MKLTSESHMVDLEFDETIFHIAHLESIALICKFIGHPVIQKAIESRVNTTWITKGEFNINFYSHGFFLASFVTEEDRNDIFQGSP